MHTRCLTGWVALVGVAATVQGCIASPSPFQSDDLFVSPTTTCAVTGPSAKCVAHVALAGFGWKVTLAAGAVAVAGFTLKVTTEDQLESSLSDFAHYQTEVQSQPDVKYMMATFGDPAGFHGRAYYLVSNDGAFRPQGGMAEKDMPRLVEASLRNATDWFAWEVDKSLVPTSRQRLSNLARHAEPNVHEITEDGPDKARAARGALYLSTGEDFAMETPILSAGILQDPPINASMVVAKKRRRKKHPSPAEQLVSDTEKRVRLWSTQGPERHDTECRPLTGEQLCGPEWSVRPDVSSTDRVPGLLTSIKKSDMCWQNVEDFVELETKLRTRVNTRALRAELCQEAYRVATVHNVCMHGRVLVAALCKGGASDRGHDQTESREYRTARCAQRRLAELACEPFLGPERMRSDPLSEDSIHKALKILGACTDDHVQRLLSERAQSLARSPDSKQKIRSPSYAAYLSWRKTPERHFLDAGRSVDCEAVYRLRKKDVTNRKTGAQSTGGRGVLSRPGRPPAASHP